MILNAFFMVVAVAQSVLSVVGFGVLINRIFNKQIKGGLDIFLFVSVFILWCSFFGFWFYGVFFDGLSRMFSLVSFYSLILGVVGVAILMARFSRFVNKSLVILESLLFISVIIVIGFDGYNYTSGVVEIMLILTFFVIVVGYFIAIDFFIRKSRGGMEEVGGR